MSLIKVKRSVPVYCTLRSSTNTGTAASSKSFNFSNVAITNNGFSIVSSSSIRVPDSGEYEFNITLGAYNPTAFVAKFQYGINGTWFDIVTTQSSTISADRFNIIISLQGNDLVEFRAVATSGLITSTFCGFRYESTSLKDTTTIKRI
jgi:hypothetical protein